MPASDTATGAATIESALSYHKTTSGGQRVYRNRDAAIRDVYVPQATAESLGNPREIVLTIGADRGAERGDQHVRHPQQRGG